MNKAFFFCLALCVAMVGCRRDAADPVDEINYSDPSMWYAVERGCDVDLFYITSTETVDYTHDGTVMHHADVTLDSVRALLLGEMQGIDHMYGGGFNFFSPYYRQCTLESYTSADLLAERAPLAMGDVRRAFDHYLEHHNDGRPFILMGFSQGAQGVVELLRTMDDEVYSRMVAAYVIGWKVTAADLAAAQSHIRAARDSADLGVTVCYNSVRSPECALPILSDGNRLGINPANWRTDATPTSWTYDGNTLTATLDTATLLTVVDGYTGDYMLPLIGRDGNYHRLDITIYHQSLCRNMALRAARMSVCSRLWQYGQAHPDGFTLDLGTLAQPPAGICVAYGDSTASAASDMQHPAAGPHRAHLSAVLQHALTHNGHVGGWHNPADGSYHFESVRLFPEDSLHVALAFARQQRQQSVYILSQHRELAVE